MSTDVVRSVAKRQTVAFAEVENVAAKLDVMVPVLDPSKPISDDFNTNWEAVQSHFAKVVAANEKQSAIQLAEKSNFPTTLTKLVARWDGLKYKVSTLMSGGALLGAGAVVFLTPSMMAWSSGDPTYFAAAVNTSMLGFLPLIPMVVGITLTMDRFQNQVKGVLNKAFNSGYEERITQWAQERYGVAIPVGAWAVPSDRVSKDIVYLGVKDGEDVYCFKSEQGWIIGYRDGTELPVLMNGKELVEA